MVNVLKPTKTYVAEDLYSTSEGYMNADTVVKKDTYATITVRIYKNQAAKTAGVDPEQFVYRVDASDPNFVNFFSVAKLSEENMNPWRAGYQYLETAQPTTHSQIVWDDWTSDEL